MTQLPAYIEELERLRKQQNPKRRDEARPRVVIEIPLDSEVPETKEEDDRNSNVDFTIQL